MIKEYMTVIKKLLNAKSKDLHDHSVFTAAVFETLVTTAHKQNFTLPITAIEANEIGLLHDIGKVYINDVIFNKQESLSEREWETIKLHPVWGKQFVDGTIFCKYGDYIIQHHEKMNGTGYPNKLQDSAILDGSHMLAIADQLASLIENRPYKRGIEDKNTLLSILYPSIKFVFGHKSQSIFSQTIDTILLPIFNQSLVKVPENGITINDLQYTECG